MPRAPKPLGILGESSKHAKYARGPEAKYEAKAPACPRELSPAAKKIYRWAAKLMEDAETLTEQDKYALVNYASWCAVRDDLDGSIQKMKPADDGYLDLLRAFRSASEAVHKYALALGFTPASRGRVNPVATKEAGPKVRVRQRGA